MSGKIVFHDPVGSAIGYPQELVGRDEVSIWRRPDAGLPHVEELPVLIENLDSPVAAIHNEQAPILADLNAVNRIELVGPGIRRILRRAAPVHQKLSILIELRHASPAVAVTDKERAVG